MPSTKVIAAAAVAILGAPASAFWRMECRGVAGQARLDPLMSPGSVAQHVHEVFGSSGFGETVDYDTLIEANCTSCAVTADKSAYWTPVPYFQDNTTGEWEAVANTGGMLPYYFLNAAPDGNQSITAFPVGFRMIAGDTFRRNYTVGNDSYEQPDPPKSEWASLGQTNQDDLAQRAIGFNCLDYTKAAEGSLYRHFLPSKDYIDANCPDGIRAELMFPSCWDGVNLDSDDHKSHVAYPDLVITGDCPDTHPVRLPGLFYETIWEMAAFSDRTGMFAFSNGDPLGFGYHGDFVMGWDQTNFTLQEAVDTCTSSSGEISACPLFTIISDAEQGACQFEMPEVLVKENVAGPMTALPGNVPLAWGPAPADASDYDDATTTAASTSVTVSNLGYSAGSTASVNGSVVPGNVFKGTSSATATATATGGEGGVRGAVAATVTPSAGLETAGTSTYTSTESGVVIISEIVYEQEITYVTEMTTTTVYVNPTAAAGARRDAHVHQHRHLRGHKH